MTRKRVGIFLGIILILAATFFISFSSYRAYTKHVQAQEQQVKDDLEKKKSNDHQRLEVEKIALAKAEENQQEEKKLKIINKDFSDPNMKVVFLTFDDGPDECSNEILDILKNNDVKATFFSNGRISEEDIKIYQRIVNEGHVLGNHSWSHNYALYKNPEAFYQDVENLAAKQKEVTGVEPTKVFRFPGGSTNANQTCRDGILARGYSYFDWNVDCGDGLSNNITPEQAYQSIVNGVHQNKVSVVLLHAERPVKAGGRQALDRIIKTLKSEGYEFMTLDPRMNLARFI